MLTSLLFDPALMPVLAAALLAVLALSAARPRRTPAYAVVAVTTRHRSGRPAYVRLIDPTAPGCHLPRAPGLRIPAA